MTTDPKTIKPGYYWFIPFEPGVEPAPCKIAFLLIDERLARETVELGSLVAWQIGEGWYEPLEELLRDGDLVPLSLRR